MSLNQPKAREYNMIVLISGRAGEGKSEFAHMCSDELAHKGKSSLIIPFAHAVKDVAYYMGWDGQKDFRGRKLLQNIGNFGREYDTDLWANFVVEAIKKVPEFEYVFIDDWRFPNEYVVIQEHFDPVLKVRMKRPKKFHALLGTEFYNDISEISLPDDVGYYDYIIENDTTLDGLRLLANDFVKLLTK